MVVYVRVALLFFSAVVFFLLTLSSLWAAICVVAVSSSAYLGIYYWKVSVLSGSMKRLWILAFVGLSNSVSIALFLVLDALGYEKLVEHNSFVYVCNLVQFLEVSVAICIASTTKRAESVCIDV